MHVVAVAYSGGRDSTALLHATCAEAALGGWRVAALHVHHGLNASADAWLVHCAERCRDWAAQGLPVAFAAHRLTGRPRTGDSVEAWARDARYAALARLARDAGAGIVLLGQHRRDQAETFLLQALRGGGVAGLAAMPDRIERNGLAWVRPWLRRSRDEIDAYVRRHGLAHIDDDSNGDPRFARNRLRLTVWPALEAAFPGVDAALAASARWAQQADAALAELAAIDLDVVARGDVLDIASWTGLSPARRSLALRAWLRDATGMAAASSLVERLLDELPGRGSGRWPHPGGELRAYRGRLRVVPAAQDAVGTDRESELCVPCAGSYQLPGWGGSLGVQCVAAGGVPLGWPARLELRARHGGEQFQAGPGRPPRSLKKQFQAAGVAAWHRQGPLVYLGGRLAYVPGLGLDARVVAPLDEPGVTFEWLGAEAGRADPAG